MNAAQQKDKNENDDAMKFLRLASQKASSTKLVKDAATAKPK